MLNNNISLLLKFVIVVVIFQKKIDNHKLSLYVRLVGIVITLIPMLLKTYETVGYTALMLLYK